VHAIGGIARAGADAGHVEADHPPLVGKRADESGIPVFDGTAKSLAQQQCGRLGGPIVANCDHAAWRWNRGQLRAHRRTATSMKSSRNPVRPDTLASSPLLLTTRLSVETISPS
jgi:hypothetical protein